MRQPRSRCWGRRGEHPARRRWRRSSTPPASRRGSRRCCPSGCGTASCASAPCWPGCCSCQADHRPAHLTRVRDALTALPRGRPGAARRDRRLETRPAPAHLPADRAHLRPGRRRPGQGRHPTACPRRPSPRSATTCWKPASPRSTSTPAPRWRWTGPTWKPSPGPPPRGTRDCADPEASWGHRSGGGPGQDSELFFGYYPSAATMMRDEHGPPVPELARRMTVCSCRHDPARALVPVLTAMPDAGIGARRHPRRLRLRPPRRRSLGPPAPAVRRAAGPGPAPAPTAAPAAPTTAPSSPTATSTARPRPARCWNSARSPATPPRTRPPPTTSRPPRPPGTSSARSPATTPTATTG